MYGPDKSRPNRKNLLLIVPIALAVLAAVGVALWVSVPGFADLTEGDEAAKLCEQAQRCCTATEAMLGGPAFMSDPAFDACFQSKIGAKVTGGTAPQRKLARNMCSAAITALRGRCGA